MQAPNTIKAAIPMEPGFTQACGHRKSLEVVFIVYQKWEKRELGDFNPLGRVFLPIVGIEENVLVSGQIQNRESKIPLAFPAPINGLGIPAEIRGNKKQRFDFHGLN